jgi:predicted MFS family arabinose efflux permease
LRSQRDRLTTLAQVFRNPQLARLELAWAGYYLGEWMQFVALSIWAFGHGGAAAVGLLGLGRMAAAALALPFGGMLADRYPRQRVLLGIYAARTVSLATIAIALRGASPPALVFALAALASVAAAPVRPSTMSLVPLLARTPQELVAANVASSTLEGLGTCLGPALGGTLALTAGVDLAVAASAGVYLGCALLVAAIRREGDVRIRPRTERGVLREVLRGGRELGADPKPRLIVLLFAAQAFVRGLMNVLLIVAAVDLLGMGTAGVGWLNAALGAGGLAGGLVAVGLVGRRRLAGSFGLALACWGAPLAVVAAWPNAWWALACIGAVGAANAVLDTSGFTLLQRTVDEHLLGRVLGVFEIFVAVSVAAGSVLASVQVAEIGIRPALAVSGLLLPALAVLCRRRLVEIDNTSSVPERELAVLAAIPLFSPLPATTLERLASRLRPAVSQAGDTIVLQGDPGDLFYVVVRGLVDVIASGRAVGTLRPGDFFGEIALLRDVERTASCVARTTVELYTLDRGSFVAAVGGDIRSTKRADDLIAKRLSHVGAREVTTASVLESAR